MDLSRTIGLDGRPVRQTIISRDPEGFVVRWTTFWASAEEAVRDLDARLAADPYAVRGYVARADPPFLYRRRRR
jgi:hypothetical protein